MTKKYSWNAFECLIFNERINISFLTNVNSFFYFASKDFIPLVILTVSGIVKYRNSVVFTSCHPIILLTWNAGVVIWLRRFEHYANQVSQATIVFIVQCLKSVKMRKNPFENQSAFHLALNLQLHLQFPVEMEKKTMPIKLNNGWQ